MIINGTEIDMSIRLAVESGKNAARLAEEYGIDEKACYIKKENNVSVIYIASFRIEYVDNHKYAVLDYLPWGVLYGGYDGVDPTEIKNRRIKIY